MRRLLIRVGQNGGITMMPVIHGGMCLEIANRKVLIMFHPRSKPKSDTEFMHATNLRRLRITMFLGMFLSLPVSYVAAKILPWKGIGIFIIAAYFWALCSIALFYHLSRCPRCHKFFTWTWFFGNSFTGRCVHCGISIQKKDLERNEESILEKDIRKNAAVGKARR